MSERAFILLFRGINVGGNKVVRMETLRAMLAELGLRGAATYIQSGNAVFASGEDEATITARIADRFTETFGFSSRPTLRSREQWQQLIAQNPFPIGADDGKRLHAVLLDAAPAAEGMHALEALATTEQLALGDGVLYLHTPDGLGRSPVAEMLDRALRVPLTARNWNTVLRLQAMAEALG